MLKNIFNKIFQNSFLPLSLAVLAYFSLPNLFLPHYWDDLWSYANAIYSMNDNGTCFIPGCIHPNLYRGHPMLFYFISSLWMDVFGTALASIKIFVYLISISTLTALYYTVRNIWGIRIASITTIIFSAQSVFLAQSTMLLPEMFLTLLTILTIWAFYKKRRFAFIIFCSALLLTKETGVILYISLGIYLLFWWRIKLFTTSTGVSQLITFILPVLPLAAFFISQKMLLGWYLFPEHMGMQMNNFSDFGKQLILILEYAFFNNGRKAIAILSISAIIYTIVKKKLLKEEWQFIILLVGFMMFYSVFSAYNFYTLRYALTIIPFFILICVIVIQKTFERPLLRWSIFIIFFFFSIRGTLIYESINDDSIRCSEQIRSMQAAVEYCENNFEIDEPIAVSFLHFFTLKDYRFGYLSPDKQYKPKLTTLNDTSAVHYVISKTDVNTEWEEFRSKNQHLKVFESYIGLGWTEVYSVNSEQ